jgi:hypothetical protein
MTYPVKAIPPIAHFSFSSAIFVTPQGTKITIAQRRYHHKYDNNTNILNFLQFYKSIDKKIN